MWHFTGHPETGEPEFAQNTRTGVSGKIRREFKATGATHLSELTHMSPKAKDSSQPAPVVPILMLCVLMLCFGCTEDAPPTVPLVLSSAQSHDDPVDIPEVSRRDLQTLIASNRRPLLVEFSVLSGCYRCDEMRSPIRRKVTSIQEYADVVRIDFNLNRSLAQEVGATVCPSYVVYSEGRVVSVRTWPTSADFVADDVFEATEQSGNARVSTP